MLSWSYTWNWKLLTRDKLELQSFWKTLNILFFWASIQTNKDFPSSLWISMEAILKLSSRNIRLHRSSKIPQAQIYCNRTSTKSEMTTVASQQCLPVSPALYRAVYWLTRANHSKTFMQCLLVMFIYYFADIFSPHSFHKTSLWLNLLNRQARQRQKLVFNCSLVSLIQIDAEYDWNLHVFMQRIRSGRLRSDL